jgi:adenylate kinase family enzyme
MARSVAPDAPLRRILVVGCPGAGKSTFARRLGERLHLPVIHLDLHYWRSGWQMPDPETWRQQVVSLVAAPAWIMDGNYADTFDVRMPRADSLIWLDYPRRKCFYRVLRRLAKDHGRSRPDLPDGCPEQFDAHFLRFVWDFPARHRPKIPAGIERYGAHLRISRFSDDREADDFLAGAGAH